MPARNKMSRIKRATARTERPATDAAGGRRLLFESLLVDLSAYFVKVPADRVDQGIDLWLEKVAEFIGVDRISLWERDPAAGNMQRRYSFVAPGAAPVRDLVANSEFSWLIERYARGEIVKWARIPDDIPAVCGDRAYRGNSNWREVRAGDPARIRICTFCAGPGERSRIPAMAGQHGSQAAADRRNIHQCAHPAQGGALAVQQRGAAQGDSAGIPRSDFRDERRGSLS